MIQTKRIVSLVLALLLSVSMFSFAAAAQDADAPLAGAPAAQDTDDRESTVDGLVLSKRYDPDSGKLILEAYVTGESQTQLITEPVDIALVLDVSGSMEEDMSSHWWYKFAYSNNDAFIKVGAKEDLSELDTEYGAENTYYLCSSFLESAYAKMRYQDGKWQYYGRKPGLIVDRDEGVWKDIESSDYGSGYVYITKMNAMKIATKRFIDATLKTSPDSSISIIKFAGNKNTSVGNGRYNDSNTDKGWSNYSQIVHELARVDANVNGLKNAISALEASGATQADFGMQLAQNTLASSTRKKVVIMFTDGDPTASSSFQTAVANDTITAAKALKDNQTTVYTVGCFSSNPSDTSNTGKYMNYVSSNYPNATSMTSPGAAVSDMRYCETVTTSADLTGIFHKISQETGGAKILNLGTATTLRDIVAGDFYIPGTTGNYEVTVNTYTYAGNNSWAKDAVTDANIKVNVEESDGKGRDVTVTGFDYSANWVGDQGSQPHGKKLVLEIKIELDENSTACGETDTNSPGSGIYDSEDNLVEHFESGKYYIPYFEIVHEHDDKIEQIQLRKYNDSKLNITEKVEKGYLYGGTFSDANRTVVADFNGGDPTAFMPVDGKTYYLHEVGEQYLAPKNYIVWDSTGALYSYYMFATVDSKNYKEVGFEYSYANDIAKTTLPVPTIYETVAVKKWKNQVLTDYQTLYVQNGNLTVALGGTTPTERDIGYLVMSQVNVDKLKANELEFTPYWITLDNVKVYAKDTRTCQYKPKEIQQNSVQVSSMTNGVEPTYVSKAATNMLRAKAAYVVGDGKIGVTIVDGDTTTEMRVAHGDLRETVSYNGSEGKVFAGWYTDEAMTVPADLGNVDSDITLYAKYVSDSFLSVKYIERRFIRVRGIYLASAVDSTDFAETGFIINGEKLTVSRYSYTDHLVFMSTRALFGKGVADDSSMMTAAVSFDGSANGDKITVTPYWITPDGTTVMGETRTLTYHTYWVEG